MTAQIKQYIIECREKDGAQPWGEWEPLCDARFTNTEVAQFAADLDDDDFESMGYRVEWRRRCLLTDATMPLTKQPARTLPASMKYRERSSRYANRMRDAQAFDALNEALFNIAGSAS